MFLLFFFFFSSRRRHTRWNCDWSSDVCSSDLGGSDHAGGRDPDGRQRLQQAGGPDRENAKGEPLLLKYGAFIQSIVDFVIIAFVLFVAIRAINRLKKPPVAAAPSAHPRQEILLVEIRDLLAKR